jgi:hypothetical protein
MNIEVVKISAWIGLIRWAVHPVRWLMLLALAFVIFCLPAAYAWKRQANELSLEQKQWLAKGKRTAAIGNKLNQGEIGSTAKSVVTAKRETSLALPALQVVKASPLADHLSDAKVRGLDIKQVEYVWGKAAPAAGQDRRIGRMDVNLNLTGSYTLIRKW